MLHILATTLYTNSAVPAFSDVADSFCATLAPAIASVIGVGVLVAGSWFVWKQVLRIFGIRGPRC